MKICLFLVIVMMIGEINTQAKIGCLNPQGKVVDWFVILTTTIAMQKKDPDNGYLYFDSETKTDRFTGYSGFGNQQSAPIGRTIDQVSKHGLLNTVWNDQFNEAWGIGSGDTKKAHAKGYIAVTADKSKGFFMDHSVPHYPYWDKNDIIQKEIEDSQQKKVQHHLCITIQNAKMGDTIFKKNCFIEPNIYINKAFSGGCVDTQSTDKFWYADYQLPSTTIRAVYKNGYKRVDNYKGKVPYKSDMFAEGIAPFIESSIIVQAYGGRKAIECPSTGYQIGNSKQMTFGKSTWKQGGDHSKWAYALDNDYACFGDNNRDTSQSQLVRGGAFYCINNSYLNKALKNINPNPDACADE